MIAWWRRLDRRGRLLVSASHLLAVGGITALVWWWDTYWAQYVATNMLPPSVWTLVGIAVSHLRLEARQGERHEDLKQHVTNAAGGSDGQGTGLRARRVPG